MLIVGSLENGEKRRENNKKVLIIPLPKDDKFLHLVYFLL